MQNATPSTRPSLPCTCSSCGCTTTRACFLGGSGCAVSQGEASALSTSSITASLGLGTRGSSFDVRRSLSSPEPRARGVTEPDGWVRDRAQLVTESGSACTVQSAARRRVSAPGELGLGERARREPRSGDRDRRPFGEDAFDREDGDRSRSELEGDSG